MKAAVIVFPGTNCDTDICNLVSVLGGTSKKIWHADTRFDENYDVVFLPGGFSYGDYLRTGALARVSPIMEEVKNYADKGAPVIGICNGFQILCEAGLLPGVLFINRSRRFESRFATMRTETARTPLTKNLEIGTTITCPVAHFEGNYTIDDSGLKRLQDTDSIVFRYSSKDGDLSEEDTEINFNGSKDSIAGICNEKGNVVAFMPHPERASDSRVGYIGGDSGRLVFESLF